MYCYLKEHKHTHDRGQTRPVELNQLTKLGWYKSHLGKGVHCTGPICVYRIPKDNPQLSQIEHMYVRKTGFHRHNSQSKRHSPYSLLLLKFGYIIYGSESATGCLTYISDVEVSISIFILKPQIILVRILKSKKNSNSSNTLFYFYYQYKIFSQKSYNYQGSHCQFQSYTNIHHNDRSYLK